MVNRSCGDISRVGRRYVGRSTASDDPYEKLMLSDLEIHPRAFDAADSPHVGPRDLCDRSLAARAVVVRGEVCVAAGRRRNPGGCLKGYTLSRVAPRNPSATRETLKSQTTRQPSPDSRKTVSDRKFPPTKRISPGIYIRIRICLDVTVEERKNYIWYAIRIKSAYNGWNLLEFYMCTHVNMWILPEGI